MKKFFFLFFILTPVLLINTPSSNNTVYAQTGFNTVLEYCTGTWCGYCPCGHQIVDGIKLNYPNTVILAYHGAGSDPWISYSAGIIAQFGFNAYPTGVIGRRTGILSRSAWNNQVVIQSNTVQPGVSLQVNNFNYNAATRTVTANIVTSALENLSGTYKINFVLTEDNLIYPQVIYASCGIAGTDPNYEHDHVVKGMINGDLGTIVNTGSTWDQGVQYTIPLNYVIPAAFVPANCTINVFVYKAEGSISTQSFTQQATKFNAATGPTGINPVVETAKDYQLSQNYPNPFNPSTHIYFSIPRKEKVTLKVYDMIGNLVETLVDQELNAGTYNAELNASAWASGVYFYSLTTSSYSETKKMTLVK